MNQNRYFAYACLATCMSLVGVYVALSKPLVAVIPVFLLAWLRYGIAGIAMLGWLRKPADEPLLTRRTQVLLFFESFIGTFLFSICMLYGMSLTTAVAAGVILASIPACIAVLSWCMLGERVRARTWLAVVCAVLGIALVSLSKQEHSVQYSSGLEADLASKHHRLGNALLFAAVVCEAFYVALGKKLSATLSAKRIASLMNLWAWVLMTPLGLWQLLSFDLAAVRTQTWGLLVFYALAGSMLTVWLWMTGLKTVPASQAGVFTALLPIAAAATGVLLLGETMNAMQIGAFAIALFGVLLATYQPRQS